MNTLTAVYVKELLENFTVPTKKSTSSMSLGFFNALLYINSDSLPPGALIAVFKESGLSAPESSGGAASLEPADLLSRGSRDVNPRACLCLVSVYRVLYSGTRKFLTLQ